MAILLVGGDKTGDDRWYEAYVPVADRLYDEHERSYAGRENSMAEQLIPFGKRCLRSRRSVLRRRRPG